VRARLLDIKGNVVAQGDDRSNDWNFLIAQKLHAGDYQLEVEAVSNNSQATVVFMGAPNTLFEKTQALPIVTSISDNDAHVYPLRLPDKKSLLVVQAESVNAVGLSVEVQNRSHEQPMAWTELGSATGKAPYLILPYHHSSAQPYRVRVWSVDRRGANISFEVHAVEPKHYREQQLSNTGIRLEPLSDSNRGSSSIAVAAIDLMHPGVFKVDNAEGVLWSSRKNELLSETYNGLITAGDTTLWLAKRVAASEKTARLRGSRVVLADEGRSRLQMAVSPHQIGQLDVKAHDKPLLVIAESRVGQAGVQLINDLDAAEPLDARHFAIAQQSAVAAAVKANNPVVKVWNAAAQSESLEVSLRRIPFTINNTKTISEDRFQQALPAATALPLTLPKGPKRITLTFPPDTAAIFRREEKTNSTHWSGNSSQNEVIYSQADEILILNAGATTQHVALTVDSLGSVSETDLFPVLDESRLFQQRVAYAGTLKIPVKLSGENTPSIIRIRGSSHGTYIQNNGRIQSGTDLAITGSGELLLEHQPGMVLAWLDTSSHSQPRTPIPVMDITTNRSISLQGEQQSFQANLQDSVQLQLRSDTALITRITYTNGKKIVEAHPQGVNYSVYLPAGYATITFHRLGLQTMNGVMFISSVPIVTIREGYGPESILSGGSSQMYEFEIKKHGQIGLGVQASSDVVSGKLMDNAGNVLSQGVVHMPELAPGRYVFAVSVPPNSLPVQVRPALVGLERPPTGPPWEVIKNYLQQAGRKLDKPLKP
jgi:hypothetical protein